MPLAPSGQAPLVLHTDSSRSWGGQEMHVLVELVELRKRGFRTALLTKAGVPLAARAADAGIEVHGLPDFHKANPAVWLRVFRLLRRLSPVVVSTNNSDDAWVAGLLARLTGVPLVLRTRHVLMRPSSLISYRFHHEFKVGSEAIAASLVAVGLPRDHMTVAPTGTDPERFRFSAEKRREMRRRYGFSDDELVIGNVAFLRDYKGHAFILDTLAGLDSPWRALLVGDGDLRGELEEQARRLGLGERLIFAGHQERPEDFYHAFDVFFWSSRAVEAVAQSLQQALLNGLPVLACTECPSNAEALQGVAASRLVAYGDTAAAARALAELAALPRRDPEIMAAQREAIAARYGLPAMMRNILALYARYGITPA